MTIGAATYGAALLVTARGLVDELVGYTAGVLLGGDGRAAVGPLGLQHLSDAPRFRLAEARPLGGDLFHRWVRDA